MSTLTTSGAYAIILLQAFQDSRLAFRAGKSSLYYDFTPGHLRAGRYPARSFSFLQAPKEGRQKGQKRATRRDRSGVLFIKYKDTYRAILIQSDIQRG